MFSLNTNIASLQAQNYLNQSSAFQNQTIQEVTSGLRIVNSGDDAAGLAIANGLRSSQAVLTQGIRNANDGLSTLQTIDGGMSNISQPAGSRRHTGDAVGIIHVHGRPRRAKQRIPERADGS